jgi:hypothetical protein
MGERGCQFSRSWSSIHVNDIVALMWRLHKTGIGLTTGFTGSHTVTHNYSVYTLQLTRVHHNTCRVSSLCVHWLPIFQYRRICPPSELTCNPATLLLRLLLHCRLSTGQLDSQLTTNCTATRLDYWLTDWLTNSATRYIARELGRFYCWVTWCLSCRCCARIRCLATVASSS